MRKLLDLFEAPVNQGVTGNKLAQTSGGQFMNKADRLNPAKVNAALGNDPSTGKPYVPGSAAANLALAKKFSQPAAQPAAQAPTISDRAATDTNVAGVGKAPATQTATTVPADQALDAGEEIVDNPATDTRAAAAMASKSAPASTQTSDQVATAALNTAPAADANVDQEATAARDRLQAQVNNGSYKPVAQVTPQAAPAATNTASAPKSDYQPVAGTTNVVSRTADKIAADQKAGGLYGQQNQATKSYASFGDFASAVGDKVKGMFGGNQPAPSNAASAMASKSAPAVSTPEPAAPAPEPTTTAAKPGGGYGQFTEEELEEELEEMMRLSGMPLNEKAPPTAKGERMVKHIKAGYAKDGKLSKKEKSIAYATAWKQHNKEKVTEDVMLDEGGHALKHIANRFKHEVKNFMNSGHMADNLYDALYDYYYDIGELPYGIAKAREGDPRQWVEERFYADMGSGMSESVGGNVTPGTDTLSELARLAGIQEARAPEIGSKLPKSDTETFGLQPGRGYKINQPKDWTPGDTRKRAVQQLIPDQDKKDHIRSRLGKHVKPNLPEGDEHLDEWGDSPLNRVSQPQSSGAAPTHAARERERVVSPKVDKYDKDKEAAEKARRDIVDRESPDANTFGRKIGKAVAEPIAAIKSAWHGATDAWDHTMGNDTAPDPKPPVSVVKKNDWKGDKDNPALKENDELNQMRRIAGLKECGDMGRSQSDSLNVSTNMSSDGNKSINISAQGDKADELLQMLKMAGMRPHDDHSVTMSEPEVIMIGGTDEMMDENIDIDDNDDMPWHGITNPELLANLIDQAKHQDWEEFYDENSRLLDDPREFWENYHGADGEIDEAKKTRTSRYSNTPDEEYETVDAITRQGNDLNREKRMYASKPKLGDNPMAESILDQDLNDILESILIRDDKDDPKITRDPETGRVRATFAPPKKPDQSELPLQKEPYHGPRHLSTEPEKTGTEKTDEGWEDVSNFIGDIVGTEASKLRQSQQLRDLDAMRKQYKGTEWEGQVNKRYDTHLDRLQADKGEVVDKQGEPIKVLPPQQWKGN